MAGPVKTTIKDIKRLREITRVLTKHGFHALVRRLSFGASAAGSDATLLLSEQSTEPSSKIVRREEVSGIQDDEDDSSLIGEDRSEAAIRFRRVLEDLGPTFIKLGQVMSTRPDIVPVEFVNELKHLQSSVPELDFEQVREQVEGALGRKLEDVYDDFAPAPIGAASIGQVHRARLKESGEDVVVKVQRPGIEEKIRADLDILYTLARLLEATIQEVELYSPTGILREFSQALMKELDFTIEAQNVKEFGENFRDEDKIRVPRVFDAWTTPEVMTMEFIDGKTLTSIPGGTERASRVLDTLLDAVVKMVLYDGFFHGDPHPGNIFVLEDDTLVFIDFGMVGRLSAAQQDDVIDLIISVLSGDVDTIARTLLKMGRPVGRVNMREFKADVVRIRDSYLLSNLADINVTEFVQEVMDAAQIHRIQINSSYAVLVKTASTIEGIMRELEPDLDLVGRATPYVKELAARLFSAKKIATSVVRNSMAFSSFITQFPEQMDQIMMDLEGGNLSLNMRNDALDNIGQHLNTLGTRLFLGVIAAGLAISSAILIKDLDWAIQEIPVVLILGILCALFATLLFWWALGWHIVGGKDSNKLRLSPLVRLFRR